METTGKRLVIQFEKGRTSFTRVNRAATPAQLKALARGLNMFQADPAKRVLVVTTKAAE